MWSQTRLRTRAPRLDRVCGDGWLAIGDAARFIDPVFSSGVSIAMHSARFAAELIGAAHFSGDYRRSTFLPYEDDLMASAAIWDDFTRLFFYNTDVIYTAGLDPTYLELYDADLYDVWVDITKGRIEQPSQVIRDRFGGQYVFSDLKHGNFI